MYKCTCLNTFNISYLSFIQSKFLFWLTGMCTGGRLKWKNMILCSSKGWTTLCNLSSNMKRNELIITKISQIYWCFCQEEIWSPVINHILDMRELINPDSLENWRKKNKYGTAILLHTFYRHHYISKHHVSWQEQVTSSLSKKQNTT